MKKESYDLAPMLPFRDFREASSAVLRLLYERVGLGLWLVTRTEGDDWIVLSSEDHGYQVGEGEVFRWTDSFCWRMVRGLGPRVAPDSRRVRAYADAPIGRRVEIGAYIGVPLTRPDGSLFGTLCAIDPSAQPEDLKGHLGHVEVYARLLSTILNAELERQEHARRLERAEAESQTDPLTGLYNRRGWDRLLEAEEGRCRRYGHPAGVVMVDVDGLKRVNDRRGHAAGDQLLQRVAEALRRTVRASDVVARVGGDEFAVLAVEANRETLEGLIDRMRAALADANLRASLGAAERDPRADLAAALRLADGRLLGAKKTGPDRDSDG